jgi:hypothetical protein
MQGQRWGADACRGCAFLIANVRVNVYIIVQHVIFLCHMQLCASMLTSDKVTYRGFVRGYGAFLDGHSSGGYQVFGIGRLGGCDIGFAGKLMFLCCVGGGLLISFT